MFTHPNTAQAYGSNQLNSNKGGFCDNWYNTIKSSKPNSTVKCVWGHVHSVSGDGDKVQSGGGGCCGGHGDGPMGFYAYGFTD